jgi:hypothetical protein
LVRSKTLQLEDGIGFDRVEDKHETIELDDKAGKPVKLDLTLDNPDLNNDDLMDDSVVNPIANDLQEDESEKDKINKNETDLVGSLPYLSVNISV